MKTISFENQVATLRPELHRLTFKFTSNREDSHDLVQETILKALRYKAHFAMGTNLKGWLFTIMRNIFINQYKRDKKVKHDTRNEKNIHWEKDVYAPSADSLTETKEIWHVIHSIKSELSRPFVMHLSGYQYDEIAQQLKIPLGTVKSRIFLARTQIQHKLMKYSSI